MNEIKISEALIQTFSNDPVKWGKYFIVFLSFILTVVVIIKSNIYNKLDPNERLKAKVKKAIDNKHVIDAKLIKSYSTGDDRSGKYEYEIDGKKYYHMATFSKGGYIRSILHLYYDKTPKKVFTDEENHYYYFSGIPFLILNLTPFIVPILVGLLLGLNN